ncbi:MAG: hypothetical protein ACOCY1_05930 [Halovenus sp.]
MTEDPVTPLQKLKKVAEEKEDRREKEVVACPECGTEVLKDDIEVAIQVAENHDEQRHDGKRTATVNGIVPPRFSDDEKQQIQDAVQSLAEEVGRDE